MNPEKAPAQLNKDLEQSVKEVMADTPKPIQEFLTNGKFEEALHALVQNNNLQASQNTAVEREILLILLGAKEPAGLFDVLRNEVSLDETAAQALLRDINTKIFSPLHEKMHTYGAQREGTATAKTDLPAAVSSPITPASPQHLPAQDASETPRAPTRGDVVPESEQIAAPAYMPPDDTTQENARQIPSTPSETSAKEPLPPVPLRPKNGANDTPPKPIEKGYAVDPYRAPLGPDNK